MQEQTKLKIRKAIRLINAKCLPHGASSPDLVMICATEKTDRALPSHLTTMGVLVKRGGLRFWENKNKYSTEHIIDKVEGLQRESGKRKAKKDRSKKLLLDAINSDKKPQILFSFPSKRPEDVFNESQENIKSVSHFLGQLPIDTIINHLQSKGFIVLKP